jgi:putative transposase
VCARDLDDAYLTNAAVDLHTDDPEFGYRLIADDLKEAGHQVGENRAGGSAQHSGCSRCAPRSAG